MSKARRWTWERSKVRKTLRRGAYAAEEGTKEAARFAGLAAFGAVVVAALGGLWYLDSALDDDQPL
jgi:hypothetical protein